MTSYTCEESSVCTKFQSAICLHCNLRLCLLHITEHNQIIFSSITNLSNEVNTTVQQITEESEQRKHIFDNILISANQWRTQQIEKIQHTYENYLKLVESQREILNNEEVKLFEQLEHNARQPLEHIQREQTANVDLIKHIQQTIKTVRDDNAYLKWQIVTPPLPVDIEYLPLNILSKSVPVQSPKLDNNKSMGRGKSGHSLKRLVAMFNNISSIEQSKYNIDTYINNQRNYLKLPILICSYLTAWYRKSQINEKVFLLNEHITTIQKYLTNRKNKFDALLGLQVFFFNEEIRENKSEMMTFLLQFFFNHQCIDQNQILNWYNEDNSVHRYKGFTYAKQLAIPFIGSLLTTKRVEDIQPVLTNPMSADQPYSIEIKEEAVPLN